MTLLGKLMSALILAHFKVAAALTLNTDASGTGLGAVLSQGVGSDKRVVSYIKRTLTEAKSLWSTNDPECLAVVWAVKKLRSYLYFRKLSVKTDSMVARLTVRRNLSETRGRSKG